LDGDRAISLGICSGICLVLQIDLVHMWRNVGPSYIQRYGMSLVMSRLSHALGFISLFLLFLASGLDIIDRYYHYTITIQTLLMLSGFYLYSPPTS